MNTQEITIKVFAKGSDKPLQVHRLAVDSSAAIPVSSILQTYKFVYSALSPTIVFCFE